MRYQEFLQRRSSAIYVSTRVHQPKIPGFPLLIYTSRFIFYINEFAVLGLG